MAGTPDQIAARWAAGLAAAGDKIRLGVEAVTVAPGAAAARQANVWAQNVAASQAKYTRNVAAVTLSDWQQAILTKGLPRVASGASAATPKFTAFMTKLLPYIANAKGALPPRGTFEQNKARAMAMIDAMHKFQK